MFKQNSNIKDSLVQNMDNELYVSYRTIAKFTENKIHSVQRLITDNLQKLEEFGSVRFQIEPRKDGSLSGDLPKIYFLNEPQATLILTFMRNNKVVKAFKIRLVKEFFQMRKELKNDSKPALEKPKEINLEKLLSNIQIIRSTLELKPFEMLMMDRFDPENSPIDKMGIDLSGVLLLPTELGKLIGKSAIEVNILLSQKGYQVKVNGIWQLTEKGREFGLEVHGKFQQIKWRVEAL